MKYLIVLLTFIVLFSAVIVFAIPNPAPVYCTLSNYTYNETHCVFNDGNSCELWDFYNGNCGEEYVKEFDCVTLGNELLPKHECCEGLVSAADKQGTHIIGGICDFSVGGWSICIECGNGQCNPEFENVCNCPNDCEINSKCSDCEFPCNKAKCEVLVEGTFNCQYVEDLTGQFCIANYLCYKKQGNTCIQKNDAETCLSECSDDTLDDCFGDSIFSTYSACQASITTTTIVTTTVTAVSVPDCWTCADEKYETWNAANDKYCDNYGKYNCGETANEDSACYQAACEVEPPSCWKGDIASYDCAYGDGICELSLGATAEQGACYDKDCVVSTCDGYKNDRVCDDTKEKCGSFFKEWTSMSICGECSNGGFNCTSTN